MYVHVVCTRVYSTLAAYPFKPAKRKEAQSEGQLLKVPACIWKTGSRPEGDRRAGQVLYIGCSVGTRNDERFEMMPSMARTWSRTDSAGGGRSEQEDVPDSWEDETWSPQRINASLRAQQEARTNRDTFESEQISTPSLESSFANQLQIVEEEEENAARRSDVSALPCDSLVDGANGESHESTIVTAEDMDEWEGFCAICLEEIALAEMATIPTCEHSFCVNCVLTWSTYLEVSRCPKCKVTFSYLWVYRFGAFSAYLLLCSINPMTFHHSYFHSFMQELGGRAL